MRASVTKALFWAVFLPSCVLGGIALGFQVHKYLITKPSAGFAFGLDRHSASSYNSIEKLISAAKTEVLVSARTINTERILKPLVYASSRGVSVRVIVDREVNPDVNRGCVGYLRSRKVGRIYWAEGKLWDQSIIIDDALLIYSTGPWLAAEEDPSVDSTWMVLRHQGAIVTAKDFFRKRLDKAKVIPGFDR